MVHLIVWVVLGLLALSFFGVSLQGLIENPTNQQNMSYLSYMLEMGWGYLEAWVQSFTDMFSNFGQ